MPHWVEHKLNWQTEFLLSIQTKVFKTLEEKFTFFYWIASFDKVGRQCIFLVPYLFVPFHFRICILSQKRYLLTSSDGLLGLAKLACKGFILLTFRAKNICSNHFRICILSQKRYSLASSDGFLGLANLAGKEFILLTFRAFQRSDA